MKKLKMLVLTDHSGHSAENALYPMVREMRNHPNFARIDVASRGIKENDPFFKKLQNERLLAAQASDDFVFHPEGKAFQQNTRRVFPGDYDVVWLRLPPPLPSDFLDFLMNQFPDQFFVNNPSGIMETGSKEFLIHFKELCPPMKICRSVEDIIEFKQRFPIVLKPFREFGGKGILKVDGDTVYEGNQETPFNDFFNQEGNYKLPYLAVKFLKNVDQGDKRIIVVNGRTMGGILRYPPKDSWLCNVSQGGQAQYSEVTPEEEYIVSAVNPLLAKMGVVMYGLDTLVDDNGKRVLSEINTTSIGGLPQMAKFTGKPLVKEAADLIFKYIIENKYGKTPA